MVIGKTLFIFVDESGDFNFSPTGSHYWSITALCTLNPIIGRDTLMELLYELAAAGGGQEYFHATEDLQSVRDQVFQRINKLPAYEIHSVSAEKCKCNPAVYCERVRKGDKWITVVNPDRLYHICGRTLLKYIFKRHAFKNAERIVVVLSEFHSSKRRHDAIEKLLRDYLKNVVKIPFFIYFHATKTDFNCQIADYYAWAISRKLERKDTRSYDLVKHRIQSDFDIFAAGDNTEYY
jgi:hypothetical protein